MTCLPWPCGPRVGGGVHCFLTRQARKWCSYCTLCSLVPPPCERASVGNLGTDGALEPSVPEESSPGTPAGSLPVTAPLAGTLESCSAQQPQGRPCSDILLPVYKEQLGTAHPSSPHH